MRNQLPFCRFPSFLSLIVLEAGVISRLAEARNAVNCSRFTDVFVTAKVSVVYRPRRASLPSGNALEYSSTPD
jgi:hypothetical protein